MSVYADLVVAVEPSINTVADQCHSMRLISKDMYDTIIQRDLRRKDMARFFFAVFGMLFQGMKNVYINLLLL